MSRGNSYAEQTKTDIGTYVMKLEWMCHTVAVDWVEITPWHWS